MAGLYIHIPFCRKVCHYCDFYKTASLAQVDSFRDALLKEAVQQAGYLKGEALETLYLGGGTPTVLTPVQLAEIIAFVEKHYGFTAGCEITLEANPDDLTAGYLRSLQDQTPVNRLSIGIQSLDDEELRWMNRRHTASQALDCITLALQSGYSNISADLLYGIPGSSPETLKHTLERLLELDIRHLSAYHLTIEPKTVFGKQQEKGLLKPLDETESLEHYTFLTEVLEHAGFVHYEISNWAREGFLSRHNTNYWKDRPYLGLGPAAHSYNGISRRWNVSSVQAYVEGIRSGKPCFEMETLSRAERFNEYLITSLRTMWGTDLHFITRQFGKAVSEKTRLLSETYLRSGHMVQENTLLKLTRGGYFISDRIIGDLMRSGDLLE